MRSEVPEAPEGAMGSVRPRAHLSATGRGSSVTYRGRFVQSETLNATTPELARRTEYQLAEEADARRWAMADVAGVADSLTFMRAAS